MFAPTTKPLDPLTESNVVQQHVRKRIVTMTATISQVHTSFRHEDIGRDVFAEHPDEKEIIKDKIRKLGEAIKLWHQPVCNSSGKHFAPLLTDPSCYRNCEMDIGVVGDSG